MPTYHNLTIEVKGVHNGTQQVGIGDVLFIVDVRMHNMLVYHLMRICEQ